MRPRDISGCTAVVMTISCGACRTAHTAQSVQRCAAARRGAAAVPAGHSWRQQHHSRRHGSILPTRSCPELVGSLCLAVCMRSFAGPSRAAFCIHMLRIAANDNALGTVGGVPICVVDGSPGAPYRLCHAACALCLVLSSLLCAPRLSYGCHTE